MSDRLESLLDQYALGDLTEDQTNELEVQSLVDGSLAAKMQVSKDIYKAYQYVGNQELKAMLEKVYYQKQNDKLESSKPSHRNRLILLIAGFVLLCGGLLFLNKLKKKTFVSNDQLFASYFEPFEPSTESRGGDDATILKDFYEAYNNKNYSNAFFIIDNSSLELNNEEKLMFAICALSLNKNELSLEYLNNILATNNYLFNDHALWFKALVLIKTDKQDEAKKLLQKLSDDVNADHHLDSKKLLDSIN